MSSQHRLHVNDMHTIQTRARRPRRALRLNRYNRNVNSSVTIAPLLSVRKGAQAIDFYQQAFGANVSFRVDADDGAVVASLSIGDAVFWLADESPENLNFSPESLGGGSVRLIMTVDDPDAAFERAVNAGAKVVCPVADKPYGWRVGRLVDPFGHHWEIGKPIH